MPNYSSATQEEEETSNCSQATSSSEASSQPASAAPASPANENQQNYSPAPPMSSQQATETFGHYADQPLPDRCAATPNEAEKQDEARATSDAAWEHAAGGASPEELRFIKNKYGNLPPDEAVAAARRDPEWPTCRSDGWQKACVKRGAGAGGLDPMTKFMLGAMGLIPGLGTIISGVECVADLAAGDGVGAALSCGAMGLGLVSGGLGAAGAHTAAEVVETVAKGADAVHMGREANNIAEEEHR
jgi:hypothetical protein